MPAVEIRICGVADRNPLIQKRLPYAQIERDVVVIRSPLDSQLPLNEHLVWLWGRLKFQRRYLKNLVQDGAKFACYCKVSNGPIEVLPNGAEMLHLLGMELNIDLAREHGKYR